MSTDQILSIMNKLICNINLQIFFRLYDCRFCNNLQEIHALFLYSFRCWHLTSLKDNSFFILCICHKVCFLVFVFIQYSQITLILSLHNMLYFQVNMQPPPPTALRWSNEICFSLNVHNSNYYTIKGKFEDDGKWQDGYNNILTILVDLLRQILEGKL